MVLKSLLLAVFACISFGGFSQTDVRAWYADGQVFVVWKINLPIEETYAVYASPNTFTNTSQASLIGRPFAFEYLGFGLKDNLQDTTATYIIPDGNGGLYTLALNEGLFVFTPHQSGARYFAVTKWGSTAVISGQNITDEVVTFTIDPMSDPVECHLQRVFPSPFTSGYVCYAYCHWADGRQNHWESRPDYPIMANAAKNGMPGLFLVSVPIDLDTAIAFPQSVWLHGGGGIARQSLAGSRKEVNINPKQGILVAHDDKMYGYRGIIPPHPNQPTWHYGWGKSYDPFSPNAALSEDTIINYTQRRYIWIDKWLANKYNIDTHRINIHGHSMGSAGALGLLKAFPDHYASGTIFNTGCAGPDDSSSTTTLFGSPFDNLPTNLKNRQGESVRVLDLWDLYTNCAPTRDLPVIRHWHGKSDDNGIMRWSPTVVENYKICDSIGTGIQNFWSERPHGIDMAPAFDDHWIKGEPAAQQTIVDNVDFAEAMFRSDASYPAFFNFRLDDKNNDPGTGLIGIDIGDGDNWGTWGGYHRWENVVETQNAWEATVWLESESIFSNDNSPENNLTTDVAIRKPQSFLPVTGQEVQWQVVDLISGNVLQSGTETVQSDGLVVVPNVVSFRRDIRKVRIKVVDETSATAQFHPDAKAIPVFPNPASHFISLSQDYESIKIYSQNGVEVGFIGEEYIANQPISISELPQGTYYLEARSRSDIPMIGRFVKQ